MTPSPFRIITLIAVLLIAGTVASAAGAGPAHAPVSPRIAPRVLAELNQAGAADVLVFVRGRPDLRPARALPTREAKGRFIVQALLATAEKSQAELRRLLDARGVDYQAFWIVNMLRMRADRALVVELAGRPEVERIDVNLRTRALWPEVREPAALLSLQATYPWGIAHIGAPSVWQRGTRGQGIVVAGNDTGVDWTHDALTGAYRGWDGWSADHNYNWHDAWNKTPLAPSDDQWHGTHTLGTVVGGGPNNIGVAPDARWIACRNMDRGYGTPASYVDCFQFFLAPTDLAGLEPRPDLAPHVINNSWACVASEGCYPGDPLWQDTIRPAVQALTEAGVAVVASAGNAGSLGCGSVKDPPATYPEALTVGATQSGNQIAGFSSRGPVTVDGSGLAAPDLAAPGVGVTSSVPGDGYASSQGTSMASPHVAGTIALLWSAEPALIGRLAVTEQVLRASAVPVASSTCGGDADGQPNNVYGWGVINADAAVLMAGLLTNLGGTITDREGLPLAGADVKITDPTWGVEVELRTAGDGGYQTPLLPGEYRLLVDTPAHLAAAADVSVPATRDFRLLPCVDWDADGRTGLFEIQTLAGQWQSAEIDPSHDINGDGAVNVIDLAMLVAHFDEVCAVPA